MLQPLTTFTHLAVQSNNLDALTRALSTLFYSNFFTTSSYELRKKQRTMYKNNQSEI